LLEKTKEKIKRRRRIEESNMIFFFFHSQHEDSVEVFKRKRKRVDPNYDDDGDITSPVECEESDDSVDEVPPWEVYDEFGDCNFCYVCLDLAGLDLFVCDNCLMSIHYDCCVSLDKQLCIKCTLHKKKDSEWVCHYCRHIVGVKHRFPVQAFTDKVNGNVSLENYRKNKTKLARMLKNNDLAVAVLKKQQESNPSGKLSVKKSQRSTTKKTSDTKVPKTVSSNVQPAKKKQRTQ
jgi:hypothetical protein